VNFGAPLSVDDWLAARPGVLALPREERLPRLQELADEVMRRIAAVMPVTPVPLAAQALLEHPADTIDRPRWESLLDGLRARLRQAGAPVAPDEKTSAEILDRALVMFTLRRVVEPHGDSFRIDRGQDPLLRYYANSIAHFLENPKATA
jgi:glycerol-3-phosphate O-acyltransferase